MNFHGSWLFLAERPQILYLHGFQGIGQDRIRTCGGVSQRIYSRLKIDLRRCALAEHCRPLAANLKVRHRGIGNGWRLEASSRGGDTVATGEEQRWQFRLREAP
jgi:hypothetical protein